MSYELEMEVQGDTLHARIAGERTREVLQAIGEEILKECLAQGIRLLLIDAQQMRGELPVGDAYDIPAVEFSRLWPTTGPDKVAVVDREGLEGVFRFFESVARNRGYNLRFFGNQDDAREWLGRGEESD